MKSVNKSWWTWIEIIQFWKEVLYVFLTCSYCLIMQVGQSYFHAMSFRKMFNNKNVYLILSWKNKKIRDGDRMVFHMTSFLYMNYQGHASRSTWLHRKTLYISMLEIHWFRTKKQKKHSLGWLWSPYDVRPQQQLDAIGQNDHTVCKKMCGAEEIPRDIEDWQKRRVNGNAMRY